MPAGIAVSFNNSASIVWTQWAAASANTATAITTSSAMTTDAWPLWISTGGNTITSVGVYDNWPRWIAAGGTAATAAQLFGTVPETAEEKRYRAEAHVKRQAAKTKADEARVAAKGRAKKLLMDCLTPIQRGSLEALGYFDVFVGGKTYRIKQGTHGNVREIVEGKEVTSFCVQPDGVPDEDAMLAQKLWLETDEREFLRVANARVLA